MNKIKDSLARLDEISNLKYNWNGNRAGKFTEQLIEFIREIVKGLDIQPDIFPTGNSSIQMEYTNKNGDYLEFEIFETKKIHKYTRIGELDNTEYVDVSDINNIVNSFM